MLHDFYFFLKENTTIIELRIACDKYNILHIDMYITSLYFSDGHGLNTNREKISVVIPKTAMAKRKYGLDITVTIYDDMKDVPTHLIPISGK